MSFAHFKEHSIPLFKDLNILILEDTIKLSNILFTYNTIINNTPVIFRKYFDFKEIHHQHSLINNLGNVYSITKGSLQLPNYKTNSKKKHQYNTYVQLYGTKYE